MDLSLQEIKTVLAYDDLEKIIDFLTQAEKKGRGKMATLQHSKAKIQLAKADYTRKLQGREPLHGIVCKACPERVILLSDTLKPPRWTPFGATSAISTGRCPLPRKPISSLRIWLGSTPPRATQALCSLYPVRTHPRPTSAPKGTYLCAHCTEESREETLRQLPHLAKTEYGAEPAFTVQLIVVSGILQWNYEVQVYLGT